MRNDRILAATLVSFLLLATAGYSDDKPSVRPLNVSVAAKLNAKSEMKTVSKAADLVGLLGEATAQTVAKEVNFEKEKVVLVTWTSSGPPFDTVEYKEKKETAHTVTFFIQKPKTQIRGQAFRVASKLYVVPASATVEFNP